MLVWQINLCLKLWRKSHAVSRPIAVGIVRVVYKRQALVPPYETGNINSGNSAERVPGNGKLSAARNVNTAEYFVCAV